MAKDSFLMYSEWGEQLNKLSDEQAGTLIKNIFAYKTGTEAPKMDSMTEMCFSFIKSQIERDSFKYDEICEKRREAGRKGGKANGSKCKQMQANANFVKHYDNDNEYEDDNDNDNDDDDGERKKERDRLLAEDDYAIRHEDDGKRYFEPKVKLGRKKPSGERTLTQEQKEYWSNRAKEFAKAHGMG